MHSESTKHGSSPSDGTDQSPPSRVLGLDLLRLLAVLLVLGHHAPSPPENSPALVREIHLLWERGGWVGVDLFFVLSGYLVSGLLFAEYRRHGRVKLGRFLLRRGLKIYPAFWVLLSYTILTRLVHGIPLPTQPLIGEVFFLQNYLGALWPHTWSLAVEEHFYLLLAALFWWVQRYRKERPFAVIPLLFAGLAVACLTARVTQQSLEPGLSPAALFPTHLRVDALFFGVLLSYGMHFGRLRQQLQGFLPGWRIAAGIALLVPTFIFSRVSYPWVTTFGFTLTYLGAGLMVLGAVEWDRSTHRLVQWLGVIGTLSYSIYLWHLPTLHWASRVSLGHPESWPHYLLFFVLYSSGSIAIGYLMARLIEIPVLKLRNRLLP